MIGGWIMKKLIVPAVAAAMVSAVSCNRNVEMSEVRSLSADAFISGSTKTDYSEETDAAGNPIVKVAWSDEDSFKAYYAGSSKPLEFSKTAAGTSFSAADVPEVVSAETGFTGIYGSGASLTSDGKIKIKFDEQDGTLENLAKFDVMTATSELKAGALTFAFEHKCAIIKVELENISSKGTSVNKLILSFTSSKVNDAFCYSWSTVGGEASCMTNSNPYTGLNILNVTLDRTVAPGETHTCYIAVPSMEYVNLKYDNIGAASKTSFDYTVGLGPKKSIDAGKLYTMKEVVKFNDGILIGDPD